MSLDDYVEHNRLLLTAEREILAGYARAMQAIADGLIKALAEEDESSLRRLWRWAPIAAGSLTLALASGAAEGSTGALLGEDPVLEQCIASVVLQGEEELLILSEENSREVDDDESPNEDPPASAFPSVPDADDFSLDPEKTLPRPVRRRVSSEPSIPSPSFINRIFRRR